MSARRIDERGAEPGIAMLRNDEDALDVRRKPRARTRTRRSVHQRDPRSPDDRRVVRAGDEREVRLSMRVPPRGEVTLEGSQSTIRRRIG